MSNVIMVVLFGILLNHLGMNLNTGEPRVIFFILLIAAIIIDINKIKMRDDLCQS